MNSTSNDCFEAWRQNLRELTSTRAASQLWRARSYRFAHALGASLASPPEGTVDFNGPVLYGVWLEWGLLYVGQTTRGSRRLRDLAVGESHHLGNSFPPEIWSKVAVVAWPFLPSASAAIKLTNVATVGLALEHLVQQGHQPLVNEHQRRRDGGWRTVQHAKRRSRGALAADTVTDLFNEVQASWERAEAVLAGDSLTEGPLRVVSPTTLLD